MATKEQCEYYDKCGFVKWRVSGVNGQAFPLPSDGDCGVELFSCSRLNPDIPIFIEDFGPKTATEMKASLPRRTEGEANR